MSFVLLFLEFNISCLFSCSFIFIHGEYARNVLLEAGADTGFRKGGGGWFR